jgi:excisionase family DNA binding protein
MTEQEKPLLLTVPEVAQRLSLGKTQVWKLVRSGELPSVRSGRSVRVSVAALYAWIAAHEQQKAG